MEAIHDESLSESDGDWSDLFDIIDPLSEEAVGEVTRSDQNRKRKSRDDEEDGTGLGVHMVISREERQWALALKEAITNDNETKEIPISDMEITQFAMVERGNVAKAVARIKLMHQFRIRHKIEESTEQGVESVQAFMEQQPGFLLNIDQCARNKHYVQVMDFSKFYPARVHLDKDWTVFLSGMHYLMTSLHPTLAAVRHGIVGIVECEGMGWHNFCMDFEARMWAEHPTVYPAQWHEVCWVRPPTAANVMFSLLKPIMPAEIRNICHLGAQFDESYDGRLDGLFLQPSPEIAKQRQIRTVQSFLAKRYYNQAHFRL